MGVNMTDTVVEHFRRHDVEKGDCELEISDVFDMLGLLLLWLLSIKAPIFQVISRDFHDHL